MAVHQLDHPRVHVQLVVVEHEPGHAVGAVELHDLRHDVLGGAHADAAEQRRLAAAAEAALERAAELRDHGQRRQAVDRVVVAVHVDQVARGNGQRRSGACWSGTAATSDRRRRRASAESPAGRGRSPPRRRRPRGRRTSPRAGGRRRSPGRDAAGLFALVGRVDQRDVRAAEDDPRVGARLAQIARRSWSPPASAASWP